MKGHFQEKKGSHKIPFDEKNQLYTCPTRIAQLRQNINATSQNT